ncbi:hypothetical protein AN959_06030, partial [Psychrobacillus sp. FJAT-21963]
KLNLIDEIGKKWPEITNIIDISHYIPSLSIEKLKENILKSKQEINKFDTKINDYKKYVGQVEELQIKIKDLGLEYLEKDTTENCPLCGVKHNNHGDLIKKINERQYTKEEKFLSELDKKRYELIKTLSEYEVQLEDELKKQNIINITIDCYKNIFKSPQHNVNIENIENLYNDIFALLNQKNEFLNHKFNLDNQIKFIEEDGFNHHTITNSKLFITRDKFYNEFQQQNDISEYEDYLLNLLHKYNKLVSLNNSELDKLSRLLIQTETELLKIQNNLSNSITKKHEISQNTRIINDMNNSINQLNNYFQIDNNIDLFIWLNDLQLLQANIEKAINYLNSSRDIEKDMLNLKSLEVEQGEITGNIIACENAIGVLNGLPKHEEFVQSFIKNNLSKIEYLFKSIHSPKEFVSLEFDNTGIIAIREKNGVKAKAHQMSTGQRVSLALSVMFTHFLAAPNAPDFLLLDEPVANMDDLHLLNLLDIIRELALRGTQIIFTTANPDVAGLFRRKFSFFGQQFKKFEFIREDNGLTTIKELVYSPELEDEIIINTI